MTPTLVAFLGSLLAALALTPLARRAALRFGVVDLPSSPRKIHQGAIPRLGGVAVCLAFLLGVALAALDPSARARFASELAPVGGLLLGAFAMTAFGVWDDLRGLSYRQKFLAEFAVALVLYQCGYKVQVLALPWLGSIHLGPLALPLTLLWLVGVTNAVNLIDGLDGLAAGISVLALGTVALNCWLDGAVMLLPLAAALCGATLGFLPYNVHPARIFLGDGGSLLLGTALGALSLRAYSKAPATMALLGPVLLLGLPITDTLVSILRRYLRGRSPFEADREHLHHRLLALGLSHRSAVLALYAVAASFSALTLALRGPSPLRPLFGAVLAAAMVVALLHALNYREVLHLYDGLRVRRLARARARERLLALKEERRRWRSLASPDELWMRIAAAAPGLGLAAAELHLPTAGSFRTIAPESEALARERFPLCRGDRAFGELVVAVAGHRTVLLDDERLVYEYLADFVADALEEIAHRAAAAPGTSTGAEEEPQPERSLTGTPARGTDLLHRTPQPA
jgi:UDP-GlcNAc:undecaprenyl-phosphate GlcNAc-1-phosphate transferase